MSFNKHLELRGKHAAFSASQSGWAEKSPSEVVDYHIRSFAQPIGTALHDIARKHIDQRVTMKKAAKSEVMLNLVADYGIPAYVIGAQENFDLMYDTVMLYINDAIRFNMVTEQPVYYSDLFFGTIDAVTDLDYILLRKELRIHDLKTGTTPAKMRQLEVYAAELCLEYDLKPDDLFIELRIYQGNEVVYHNPTPDEILYKMNLIVDYNDMIIQHQMKRPTLG